jgi:hypothetical protein
MTLQTTAISRLHRSQSKEQQLALAKPVIASTVKILGCARARR